MNNNNPLPFLRVVTAKMLGTKLKNNEHSLYSKLANTSEFLVSNTLNERTRYLFVIEGKLHVQIYAVNLAGQVVNVTETYLVGNQVIWHQENEKSYTICRLRTKTKPFSLLFVWHDPTLKQQLYFASYCFKKQPIVATLDILQQIAIQLEYPSLDSVFCYDLNPQQPPQNDNEPFGDLAEFEAGHMMEVQEEVNNTNNGQVGWPVNHQPQHIVYIVHIAAAEIRRWTWTAKVLEVPEINATELYMRGGQACNSVIIQCKQKMYETYPDYDFVFELDQQSRAKDPFKVSGQNFLNSVLSWLGATKSTKVTVKPEDNVPADSDLIEITVFELERPRPGHACWIAQVCDDQKQLALELRSKGIDLDSRHQLIEDMKHLVRGRMWLKYGGVVGFTEKIHDKTPNKPREDADMATNNLDVFSGLAQTVKKFFS